MRPYDTVAAVHEQGDLLEDVTSLALIAALETGWDLPDLRVTPAPSHRAVIVASHTEVVHMTPATLVEMSRALAWEGFDADVIPHGQAITSADLANTELVVVLPVIDYPGPGGDLRLYDEAWSDEEIEALVTYVERGGRLVLTNSAHRIYLFARVFDANEDEVFHLAELIVTTSPASDVRKRSTMRSRLCWCGSASVRMTTFLPPVSAGWRPGPGTYSKARGVRGAKRRAVAD